jgi:hypothetical protein
MMYSSVDLHAQAQQHPEQAATPPSRHRYLPVIAAN